MYYKRHERHWRVAVFFGGAAVAGACRFTSLRAKSDGAVMLQAPLAVFWRGVLVFRSVSLGLPLIVLAYQIGHMGGVGGKTSWHWVRSFLSPFASLAKLTWPCRFSSSRGSSPPS